MPPSYGTTSSSPSAVVSASFPPASTTLDLPKVRRQRPGISFFYRMLNVNRFSQLPPHVHYTYHSHLFWITFMPISVRPNEMLVESALNHCFSVKQDFLAVKVHELIFKSGISRSIKFQILKHGSLDFEGFRLFLFDQLEPAVAHCSHSSIYITIFLTLPSPLDLHPSLALLISSTCLSMHRTSHPPRSRAASTTGQPCMNPWPTPCIMMAVRRP